MTPPDGGNPSPELAALLDARTAPETIAALWALARHSGDPPAEPALCAVRDWDCPPGAMANAGALLHALAVAAGLPADLPELPPDGWGWGWAILPPDALDAPRPLMTRPDALTAWEDAADAAGVQARLEPVGMMGQPVDNPAMLIRRRPGTLHFEAAHRAGQTVLRLVAMHPAAPDVCATLADVQAAWASLPDANRARHPLAPILAAWAACTPIPATVDGRAAGIMPAAAGAMMSPNMVIQPDPNHRVPDLGVWPPDPGGAQWLPGLEPLHSGDVSALMLALLDAGSESQRGPGAPLRDRVFAECLMLATTHDRASAGDRRMLIGARGDPLTIADAVDWFGWDRRAYRKVRHDKGGALARALVAVNAIRLPLNARGGWLVPVFAEAAEGLALADRLAVSVRLPPGSEVGARVDRQALRQAGRVSAIAWRLYLAFCFEWNRIAWRGRVPHLTRPRHQRDAAGYLTDARGKVLTDRGGRPLRSGRHPRAVDTGDREPNPRAERLHRVYDRPRDLARLAFPLAPAGARQNFGRTERQAIIAARWLAREDDPDGRPVILNRQAIGVPAVRIERMGGPTRWNPDGFPWRIVPPWTR